MKSDKYLNKGWIFDYSEKYRGKFLAKIFSVNILKSDL